MENDIEIFERRKEVGTRLWSVHHIQGPVQSCTNTDVFTYTHYFGHTLLFHFPVSFANISVLSLTANPCMNLLKLEQMFNKCLNPGYEREIHHLFKGCDMND